MPAPISIVAVVASLIFSASLASAQLPGAAKTAPKSPTPAPTETTEQARARVQKQLDQQRDEDARPPDPVPSGIHPSEIEELRDARLKLAAAYDVQLRALEQIDQFAASRKDAEAKARDWTGFDTPPPYSILLVDELRIKASDLADRMRQVQAGLAQVKVESERVQEALRRADQEARRANEAFESASNPDAKALTAWRRKAAETKERSAAAMVAATTVIAKARGDYLASMRAEHELLERQIAIASRDIRFDETELANARKQLSDRIAGMRRELLNAETQIGQRLRERDEATAAQTKKGATPADAAAAEARRAAIDSWVAAKRDLIDALRGQTILSEEMLTLWDARYGAMRAEAREEQLVAQARLRDVAQQVAGRKAYVQNVVRDARTKLAQAEARASALDGSSPLLRLVQEEVTARREALMTTERLQSELDTNSSHLAAWVAEIDQARAERDWRTRLHDSWLALRTAMQSLWNFELFAVEDTTVTDGQTVTVSRGVTVGKSIGAVLLFVLGLIAMVTLARGVEHRLVARGYDAARARTGKRWMLALSAVLLLLLTLNVAKIPVTVFAFLGGALAIGAGFGMQTLIKNLVAGIVLLVERQVRVGDIVEVDNVAGTITEVNLRSSTVRAADGTEAIVPNSVFVENKVTNWTHSDNKVRRIVRVGVAYGSPVREVVDALEECAKRHGLVLGDPAPLVIFEDFGDNALIFALHFWLDLRLTTSSILVMSDLRFMIEKRFAEVGVSLAYPQRDVHLNTSKPLKIELIDPRPASS